MPRRRRRRRRYHENEDTPVARLSQENEKDTTSNSQHWMLDMQAQHGNKMVQRMVAAGAHMPYLRYGSAGHYVEILQSALNTLLAGTSLKVDGIFGSKTHAATTRFQGQHNLDVDGIVGPQTWGELDPGLPSKIEEPPPETDDKAQPADDTPEEERPESSMTDVADLLQELYAGEVTKSPEYITGKLAKLVGVPEDFANPFIIVVPGNTYQTLLNALAQLKIDASNSLEPEAALLVQKRIDAILRFIAERETQEATGEEEVSPQRKSIITLALSQIGKVVERQKANMEHDPLTDKDQPTRYGWETLDEYFDVAYGGRAEDKYNSTLQHEVKFANTSLSQDWCGIFVQWVMKSNGVPLEDWGSKYAAQLQKMGRFGPPQPGDILNKPEPNNHFSIVTKVVGNNVYTIDGNIGGEIKEQHYTMDYTYVADDKSIKTGKLLFADIDKA